jgi:hypothetical protein
VFSIATKRARLPSLAAISLSTLISVIIYCASSGPAVRGACWLSEEEVCWPVGAAVWHGYRPLFQVAKGVGLEAHLLRYVNWWIGGELAKLPRTLLGIEPQDPRPAMPG